MKNLNVSQMYRTGFTLVEIVVVVLIVGILAAVAAPRWYDSSGDSRISATQQSLTTIRNAIELHRATLGGLPGDDGTEADFKNDLGPFLQSPFPSSQHGMLGSAVRVQTTGSDLTVNGGQAWAYDNASGAFMLNHADGLNW